MKYYEWSEEEKDDDGDIANSDFSETLRGLNPSSENDLCLVLNIGNDKQGLTQRYWAYVTDEKLPDTFSDAMEETTIKVPDKFKVELRRYLLRKNIQTTNNEKEKRI